MRVLVVNTGSSSVQLQVVSTVTHQASADDGTVALSAKIESLKGEPKLILNGAKRAASATTHANGAQEILRAATLGNIDAVAHRVVHGGERYSGPTRIDDEVERVVAELDTLAPLHNKAAHETIAILRRELPQPPHIAIFDTAFHATLPESARLYGIDPALAAKHGIRRYGFHGTAYRYMVQRYQALSKKAPGKVVAIHLGGGCSVAAINSGRSVETSMGMTPLEGLVMGTRAGDIDPGVIEVIGRGENLSLHDTITVLNQKSGLRAISGLTEDTRILTAKKDSEPRAQLALDLFIHRIVKYVGAYLAVLGGAEAILLGGVINENTPYVREGICRAFAWCGLTLDKARNTATIDRDGVISTDDSHLHAWVIPAREDLQLAHEAAGFIERNQA